MGEGLACRYLEKAGYNIICRNKTYRGSEMDIIACDEKYIVFVEVKTRKNENFGRASEAVDAKKKAALVRCAERFLYENEKEPFCVGHQPRFDVIEVYTQSGKIVHIKNMDIN